MGNDCSLGRQFTISNVMLQRAFLEGKIKQVIESPKPDGASDIRYYGHIYPENMTWLIENDFDVHKIRVVKSDSSTFGLETYIITPKTSISLNEEELEEAVEKVKGILKKLAMEDAARKAIRKEEHVKAFMDMFGIDLNDESEDDDSSFDDGDYDDDECEYDESEPEDECFFTPGGNLS